MLIKTYRKKGAGFTGQDKDSWDANWLNIDRYEDNAASAESDHLAPFFRRYFTFPPGKILEGGCGTGKYVISYRKLGYDIIGVDFAAETIRRIKNEMGPGFPVHEADVTSLPFKDDYFDCYYSGGVIEHFEEGPDKALREAWRVLKEGGVLLATVPYVNLIRRLNFIIRREKVKGDLFQRRADKCGVDQKRLEGYEFCEFTFDKRSLKPFFENNGFRLERLYPTDILWGELGGFLRKISPSRKNKTPHQEKGGIPENNPSASAEKRPVFKRILYELFVSENIDNRIMKIPISILNHLSGHMALFVGRKFKPA